MSERARTTKRVLKVTAGDRKHLDDIFEFSGLGDQADGRWWRFYDPSDPDNLDPKENDEVLITRSVRIEVKVTYLPHPRREVMSYGNLTAEANALEEYERRRDACQAACKGIPTEALEAGVVAELLGVLRGTRSALAGFYDPSEDAPDNPTMHAAGKALWASEVTIAKATGS